MITTENWPYVITRKIDDLGRIGLPKDMRNALNIVSGDKFSIYAKDGKIILEPITIDI